MFFPLFIMWEGRQNLNGWLFISWKMHTQFMYWRKIHLVKQNKLKIMVQNAIWLLSPKFIEHWVVFWRRFSKSNSWKFTSVEWCCFQLRHGLATFGHLQYFWKLFLWLNSSKSQKADSVPKSQWLNFPSL